ncbi:hypothetical protein llap_12360 [Limosa lapponica baueri]|uniref:Uncharacterized protein n=1 Tax=Limosa lapponica baueri TaxID=1758121 RepID=A0A2I0TU68_LIMLA|nr:hypothetical protein llap_12360 [Limosa lapponica baueri]
MACKRHHVWLGSSCSGAKATAHENKIILKEKSVVVKQIAVPPGTTVSTASFSDDVPQPTAVASSPGSKDLIKGEDEEKKKKEKAEKKVLLLASFICEASLDIDSKLTDTGQRSAVLSLAYGIEMDIFSVSVYMLCTDMLCHVLFSSFGDRLRFSKVK